MFKVKKTFGIFVLLLFLLNFIETGMANSNMVLAAGTDSNEIEEQLSDQQESKVFFSENIIKQRLSDAIALLVGSSNAYVNGVRTKIDKDNMDVKPIVKDGRTLVPVRFISEGLGAVVNWDEATSTIGIALKDKNVEMALGSNKLTVNNSETLLDVPAQAENGRTLLPLRALVESLGKKIFWDDRGLIIISEKDNFYNAQSEEKMIKETINALKYERPNAKRIIADLENNNPNNEHPRILARKEDFERVKANLNKDPFYNRVYEDIKKQADSALTKPVTKYGFIDDLRMASPGTMQGVVEPTAFMYRVTGEQKYAERAWKDLEAASQYPDWNERHFLDCAGMIAVCAVGYDWLYDYLTAEQKTILRNAIKDKGLIPAQGAYEGTAGGGYNREGWVTGGNNWNIVCNGGVAMGALAIGDEEEALAGECLEGGLRGLEYILPEFAPDGAWKEGIGYWSYTVHNLTNHLASMDSALGTDYEYFNIEGIERTGYFPAYMTGPHGAFNFADSDSGFVYSQTLFWFANKLKDSNLAGYHKNEIMSDPSHTSGVRDIIWYNPENCNENVELPLDASFGGEEIFSLRSGWNDPNALYVAALAGQNNYSHCQLENGSFVLDALGERWVEDLGKEDYNLPGYWEYGSTGRRWTYYKSRAEGNNTIIMNPGKGPDQDETAKGKVSEFESKSAGAFGVLDISSAFTKYASEVKRGIMLTDNRRRVVVQDEIKTKGPVDLWWFIHTRANIEVAADGKSAILSIGSKRLWVGLQSPFAGKFTVMDAKPLPTSPNPEGQAQLDGVKKLAIQLQGISNTTISVSMIPLGELDPIPANLPKPIATDSWKVQDGTMPQLSGITVDGKPLEGFDPKKYNYTIELPYDAEKIPVVDATGQNDFTITQAEKLPGAAKITMKGDTAGSLPTAYYVSFKVLSIPPKAGNPEGMKPIPVISAQASYLPQPEHPAEHSIDGKNDTWWSSSENQWVEYDLGSTKKIGALAAIWYKGDVRVTKFDIEVSEDGKKWENVYTGSSTGKNPDFESYLFKEVEARYVRVIGRGNSENGWISIIEAGVFGE